MMKIDIKISDDLIQQFHQFLETEGQEWRNERKKKDKFFEKYFLEQEIDKIEEGALREFIHILWAFNGWTNKDWLLKEMLSSGLETIKSEFKQLLYGKDSIAKRFDSVKEKIRMMGATSISEILAHYNHKKYPIWSVRARQGLIYLGINESQLPKYTQISGSKYVSYCRLVREVCNKVASKYEEFTDLFTLDFLLYFISIKKLYLGKQISKPIKVEDFDHDIVVHQILELGDGLGFEVQKEFTVAKGCRIDAIWISRIANLGTISYAFEVHRKGSRDSAILNLQRVKRDSTIQKVIVVSSKSELEKFEEEILLLDEDFRNSVGYFEVEDLQNALDYLQNLKDILRNLGLISI